MIKNNVEARFDLYMVKSFFDAEICRELVNEMRRCHDVPATVSGMGTSDAVAERVRRVTRLMPSQKIVETIRERLLGCRDEVGEHFGLNLDGCEDPQFLRYNVGDFFAAHQDGNTGLLRLEREQSRKVSVVIFLNRQSEIRERDAYCGGSLVFSEWRPGYESGELRLSGETGTFVTFRAETTHEVVPVTHGERYSIVSWYV